MSTLRALTLWQPWATLWCSEAKVHETRRWPTMYRGWIAVHAGLHPVPGWLDEELEHVVHKHIGRNAVAVLPLGAVVGAVEMIDCMIAEEAFSSGLSGDDLSSGDFTAGRWAWKRGRYVRLPEAIPCRGAQSLWTLPDDVAAVVQAAIDAVPGPAAPVFQRNMFLET